MGARRGCPRVLALLGVGIVVLSAGPKKPYQNVNREIVIEAYWADSQPAANILPASRVHDREEKEAFEGRSFSRFDPKDFAKAILDPSMKLSSLLRQHTSFQMGDAAVEIDIDRFVRYVLAMKSNPDVADVLVFKSGFFLFATAKEEAWTDLMVPFD